MLTRQQRDKWAEELESGKWKQGTGALREKDKYCCLGVLFYGLNVKPGLVGHPAWSRFVHMNDAEKLSFPEIAKHVRSLPVSDEGEPG